MITTPGQLPKIVFVGTFPPTEEGIATFNIDLVTAVQKVVSREALCQVVAINLRDTSPYYFDEKVILEIDQDMPETYGSAAKILNDDKSVVCVILQHEYGLFGGDWGIYLENFLDELKKPVISIMHTVINTPEYKPEVFEKITRKIVDRSVGLVVLSNNSKDTLAKRYPEKSEKIFFIPHGVHPVNFVAPKTVKKDLGLSDKTVLTTFGLLSRDKGIEYVLKSLPAVVEKNPDVLYQILGQTHPVIRAREGEQYRNELIALVKDLDLRRNVRFVDKYLSLDELLKYLQGTDLYIATSVNPNQAVSGTFSYAIGSGRAVVSTDFVQSRETVTKDMGILVPPRDPKAFTEAINKMLEEKGELHSYYRSAYVKTRSMLWTNVAKQYIFLLELLLGISRRELCLPKISLAYVNKMTHRYGLLQFAKYDIPDKESGYTIDDNARALVVTNRLLNQGHMEPGLVYLNRKYFTFVKRALRDGEGKHNYFDINFRPTDQNDSESPKEHLGRAAWSIVETLNNRELSKRLHNKAGRLWKRILPKAMEVDEHIRPRAYLIKALGFENPHNENVGKISELADFLCDSFEKNSDKDWKWFENTLSYNNALLPESVAIAYSVTGNKRYLKVAESAFGFLIRKTFMGGVYVPIGQNVWHRKGMRRSYYDQQPEDVCAMVLGLTTMYSVTSRKRYIDLAWDAFTWFLGNNLKGIPLYNFKTGGVYDGLNPNGVNKNQGAESLVSYLLARIKIEKYC